jgi:hypothetical protein
MWLALLYCCAGIIRQDEVNERYRQNSCDISMRARMVLCHSALPLDLQLSTSVTPTHGR